MLISRILLVLVLVLVLVLLCGSLSTAFAADYQVGPNDALDIVVYDNPDLSTSVSVSAGGTIAFPLIGEVRVAGKTSRQIEALIRERLIAGKFLKDPQVRVNVAQFKSQSVAVLGQVRNPGKYVIVGASNVLDIIAEAGGLTAEAGDKILLVKRSAGEREKSLAIDMRNFNIGDFSRNHEVSTGDVLIVPKADSFYIYGEVRSPGLYRLERDMTVMQALSVGGGLTDRGTQKGLVISRRDRSGKVNEVRADLTDGIQPGDVIYVKESIF